MEDDDDDGEEDEEEEKTVIGVGSCWLLMASCTKWICCEGVKGTLCMSL